MSKFRIWREQVTSSFIVSSLFYDFFVYLYFKIIKSRIIKYVLLCLAVCFEEVKSNTEHLVSTCYSMFDAEDKLNKRRQLQKPCVV